MPRHNETRIRQNMMVVNAHRRAATHEASTTSQSNEWSLQARIDQGQRASILLLLNR